MAWFGTRAPSDEALAAHESAEESKQQALLDLEIADEKLQESMPVITALKAHNAKNHYDDFLRNLTNSQTVGG